MSDYLTSLAARTLKVAPLAQPRLTSWFEAGVTSQPRSVEVAAEDPGPVPLSPSTAASNAVTTHPEPSIVVRDRSAPTETPVPRRAPPQPRVEPVARSIEPPPPLVEARPARSPIDVGRHEPAEHLREDTRQAHKETVVPREPPRATRSNETSGAAEHRFSVIPHTGRELEARVSALEHRLVAAAAPNERRASEPAEPRTAPPDRGASQIVQRTVTRMTADVVPAQSSEPTVRVTIGRLEVRAIMPTPAPATRKTPRSNAGPSLEEYLKRRVGGGA